MQGSNETVETIAALAAQARELIRPLVRPGERCALLGFPNYANVGDSAIWLGQRALLESLGARVVYVSDDRRYDAATLRARVGNGPVFLQGGGNFGDLWPHHQVFREAAVQAFPTSPFIQLPQSIHFSERESLARARRTLGAHPRLTLMLRDRPSFDIARTEFPGATSLLCPDMAFLLGPRPRPAAPACDVVTLAREDLERASEGGAAGARVAGPIVDWAHDGAVAAQVGRAVRRLLGPPALAGLRPRPYDALARLRVATGFHILSRGRVVLTDRLHGHVLSLLLGIPHVVLDNSYGKLSSFLDAWTGHLPLLRQARTPEEARACVVDVLRSAGG